MPGFVSLESKLALKSRPIEVLGAPKSFPVQSSPRQEGDTALLVFASDRAALAKQLQRIVASASADRLTWVAYPKGGQLGTDLNRDSLAALLREHGIRPVTQIALDETWSALRFRPGLAERRAP